MTNRSDEETDDPTYADRRNFYKVEKWSRDGLRVELMLYAGNDLDKARRIFERTAKHRPRIRLTIPCACGVRRMAAVRNFALTPQRTARLSWRDGYFAAASIAGPNCIAVG